MDAHGIRPCFIQKTLLCSVLCYVCTKLTTIGPDVNFEYAERLNTANSKMYSNLFFNELFYPTALLLTTMFIEKRGKTNLESDSTNLLIIRI